MRLQASVQSVNSGAPSLELRSSTGRLLTSNFPELALFGEAVDLDVVLDGELVVFDEDRPSFVHLQHRIHVSDPNATLIETHPVVFLVFDLLRLDNSDVTRLTYRDRRRLLRSVLRDGPSWRVPPHVEDDGKRLLNLARSRDLEGVVAKRTNSAYRPSSRSDDWVKIKLRRRQDFVVGGWLEGTGGLEGTVGSLLVGVQHEGQLHFAGAVGSGLTEQLRQYLSGRFVPSKACPFSIEPKLSRSPTWVEPRLVVEVAYGEWRPGHHLRHPTLVGLRLDADPREVEADELYPNAGPGVGA